jgi:hypothetical protein
VIPNTKLIINEFSRARNCMRSDGFEGEEAEEEGDREGEDVDDGWLFIG